MNSILKNKNLSETAFRCEVLNVFTSSKVAVPISEIESKLVNFNRITLYRTIKKFIEKGIIHSIRIEGKEIMYAMCNDLCDDSHVHNHIHLECRNCNSVSCVELKDQSKNWLVDYDVETIEIYAKGLCTACK